MIIGIPKEIMHDEARVAATPETVAKFVNDGFEVLVEKTAGEGASITTKTIRKPVLHFLTIPRKSIRRLI